MPNRTEASLNNLRQTTPELEIQGPTANELPATWLHGETITLTATGGSGRYQWFTTAPEVVSIKNQQDNRCEVAIEGPAAAPILAFSARDAAIYKGLKGNKTLLKAVEHTPRNYLEAERYCQQAGGSLPTRKTIEDILKARKTEVIVWAQKSFPAAVGPYPIIWLKNEKDEAHSGTPSINLETAAYSDHTKAIETKKNEIEAQQNSLQELEDKERQLLEKGANLPEDAIKRHAEQAGFEEVVKKNELVYNRDGINVVKDPKPNRIGVKIIETFVNEALAEHREKQMALSDIREQLCTAQGAMKRQWKELMDLKVQQAEEGATTYTLCQLNPSNFDQAVASWVPNEREATPGNRFTTGPLSSPLSGDSPQLPHC